MKLHTGYLISGFIIGFILLLTCIWTQPDGKLHIIFCNVGQGDAAYIRFADGRDMLVDGGPDNGRVLTCLGRHMPFWDRRIDMVAMSHPQADHMGGLTSILERFTVGYFIRSYIDAPDESYKKMMEVVRQKHIQVKNVTQGEHITIGTTSLSVLWPSQEQIAFLKPSDSLGVASISDTNDDCLVFALRYGTFDAVFTGDADNRVEAKYDQLQVFSNPVELLKVPHHGSKTGMTLDFVNWLKPQLAIISVGKNTFGHPSREAVDMLTRADAKILRTDKQGDIEIISDGNSWKVL
jgi:competence protein ComEC